MITLLLTLACSPKTPTPGNRGTASFGDELSRLEIPAASSLWVDSARAFACTGATGVYVLDVSDPTMPFLEDTVGVDCLAIDGESGRVEVAAGDQGLQVIHPGNLDIIGSYQADFPIYALNVDAGERQAWVAGPFTGDLGVDTLAVDGVLTYSVENLEQNHHVELPAGTPVALGYDRTGLFVARDDGTVQVLGLQLEDRSSIDLGGSLAGAAGGGLLVHDDVLWAALGTGGLAAWDVLDLNAPAALAGWPGESAWGVAAVENRLYVGLDEGLLVLDITDPQSPVEVGRAALSGLGRPEGIYVLDAKAWLTDAQDGAVAVVSVDESTLD